MKILLSLWLVMFMIIIGSQFAFADCGSCGAHMAGEQGSHAHGEHMADEESSYMHDGHMAEEHGSMATQESAPKRRKAKEASSY